MITAYFTDFHEQKTADRLSRAVRENLVVFHADTAISEPVRNGKEVVLPAKEDKKYVFRLSKAAVKELEKTLEELEPDVIITDSFFTMGQKAIEESRKMNIPAVISLRLNDEDRERYRTYIKARNDEAYQKKLGEHILGFLADFRDHIVVEKEEDREWLQEKGIKNIITVIDPADVTAGWKTERAMNDIIDARTEKYSIAEISGGDDIVRIKVEDEKSHITFKVLYELFAEGNYFLGEGLTEEQYQKLMFDHGYTYAYRKCMKMLAVRDYTVREIQDVLRKQDNLSEEQQSQIMARLIGYGFLDDEAFAEYEVDNCIYKLYGRNKIKNQLEKRGVPEEVIRQQLEQLDPEEEIQRGVQKGQQILTKIKEKSELETLHQLKQRLMAYGYPSVQVSEIVARIDYHASPENQEELLGKAMEKARRLYRNRFSGKELTNRIKQYLYKKGFSLDSINRTVGEEVSEDED